MIVQVLPVIFHIVFAHICVGENMYVYIHVRFFYCFQFFCESCSDNLQILTCIKPTGSGLIFTHFPPKIIKFLSDDWYLIFPVLEQSAGMWEI